MLTTGEVAQLIADAAEASGETKGVSDSPAGAADAAARARAGAAALARAPRAALDGWLACAGTSPGTSRGPPWIRTVATRSRPKRRGETFCTPPRFRAAAAGAAGTWTTRSGARRWFCLGLRWRALFRSRPRAKNPDLREVTLEVGGKTVLRFAAAYGFRNIQNVVRKCKAGARGGAGSGDGYDFVEIMACPSGCLNGGGQLPPPPAFEPGFRLSERAPLPTTLGGTTAKALVDELEELYHTGGVRARGIGVGVGAASRVAREPGANRDVAAMYETFVRGDVGSARAKALWHTRYHDRARRRPCPRGGRPRRRRTSRSPATGSSYRERFLLDVSYSYDDVGVEARARGRHRPSRFLV